MSQSHRFQIKRSAVYAKYSMRSLENPIKYLLPNESVVMNVVTGYI